MALESLILIVRVVQLLFALIVIGAGGFVASVFTGSTIFGETFTAPSSVAFIIFCGVWTLLVVAYQVIVPRFAEKLAHKFVILAIDALTMLFWFAGFIALAVDVRFVTGPTTDWYKAAQATVAFAAFSWVLFVVTTVLNALNVFRGNTSKNSANVAPHAGV